MRKVLIGLAVFVFTVALVVLIGPQLIPADRLKQDVARQVEAATGRKLTIEGDLSFTLLPAPGVSVSGVRLANVAGAAAPDMLRLNRATVVVSLVPLLSGNIEVDRVILVEPRIELEQFADGRANWDLAPKDAGAVAAPGGSAPGAAEGGGTPAVALNNVVIRDGTLTFRRGDTVETISGINTRMMAQSLQGPFRVEGGLTARGVALELRAQVGELGVDRAIPLSLSAGAEGLQLGINGVMSGYPNAPRLSGSIEAKVADAGAAMTAFTGASAPGLLTGREAALDGTLAANLVAANISVNDLTARFGDVNATGALDIGFGETPHVDLVLNSGQVDLDALLAGLATSAGATKRAAPSADKTARGRTASTAGSATPAAGEAVSALPKGIAATVEIKIENVLFRGGVVRQARLAADLADGALNVSQFAAQLPGGSDVSLFGFVEAPRGVPTFNGQVEANSDDLRALLGWLDVDVGAVPADRLRKLTALSAIKASAENVTVTDLDLAIDTMRVRGGVAVALRDRPGLGIGLSLDRVNLDAYLPRSDGKPATSGRDARSRKTTEKAGGEQAGSEAATGGEGGGGLAALNAFDAIVQVKVGEITYQGTSIRGVNLDATLQGGNLDLRDASVASLAGAKARFSGKLRDVAGTPSADLKLALDAKDADGLLRLAGIPAPVPIGAARLDGSLAGDFDALKLDIALQALQATVAVGGTLKQPVAAPAYDLTLDVSHAEAARLFALLAGEAPGETRLGAFGLKGKAAGTADSVSFDLAARVGAGSADLKGALDGLAADAMAGKVSLVAAHPDMAGLVRTFAPDYRPALAELGPLELGTEAEVAPGTIRLGALAGKAGPVSYKGDGTLALGGARPKLTANLATSEIIVDWFLPAPARAPAKANGKTAGAAGGKAAPPAPAGGRWSREPIDVSALRGFDAGIALSAPAITYSGVKVDGPKLAATLADGTLDLTDLSGQAFGGAFGMTGQIVAAEVPRMRYRMKVDNTDAAAFINAGEGSSSALAGVLELFFPVSSLELVSGRLGAEIDVAAQGRSQLELISNLDGTGAMTLTDAVVDGIDACRVSGQLGQLNGLEGFLALIVSARGGQTRVANFDGRYTIDKGIATLPQQTIRADCGEASFAGTVDLPRWTIDMTARATFPEHRKFPGLIVEQKGPLDAPNVRLVNSNAVQQYIIGNAAESLIRKLVPGTVLPQQTAPAPAPAPAPSPGTQRQPAPPKPGTSSQQTAPPAPSKPADQFRNLLEGLIKR